jgi:uncharacterized protein (TIRG00374 family)
LIRNTQPLVKIAVGIALGAVCLWLTFRGTDIGHVAEVMGRVRLSSVGAALLLVAATVTAVGRRWQLLVQRGESLRHGSRFIIAVVVGQMLNVLLPIRLGEVVRAYSISRAEHRPVARIFATLVLERLADVVLLGVSVMALLVQLSLPVWARTSGLFTLAVSVVALASAFVLVRWGPTGLRLLDRPTRLLSDRLRLFLSRHGHIALDELRAFGDWRASAQVWALSLLIVVLAVATNYTLFHAFDLRLSPAPALMLFVVLQIGVAPASTPGNVGVFHYLVVLVLMAFGVDRGVAVAYAVVLHAVAYGPKIIAGAFFLVTLDMPVLDRAAWKQPA